MKLRETVERSEVTAKNNSCARVEGTGKNHDAFEERAEEKNESRQRRAGLRKSNVSAICVEETRGAPRKRESEDSHVS